MLRFPAFLVLCITFLAARTPLSAADLLRTAFGMMDQVAGTFKGMTADVTQVSHTAVINSDDTEAGTLAVRRSRPHAMELLEHFKTPDQKYFHFKDQKAEIYIPASNSVQIYELSKKNHLVQQFLLIGFGSSSEDVQSGYSVKPGAEETVDGQKSIRLELTPKSPDVAKLFQLIEIWIAESGPNAGLALQQKLHEQGGDYILAKYANIRLDSNLPASAVTLTVPKDAARTYPTVP
jgi:outer membrane lipoprotein-sorting protein